MPTSVHQVWLFHPVYARDGQRFYSDDLPAKNSGWVDDPDRMYGAKYPKDPPPEPERTCLYHADKGAKVFLKADAPGEADGWYESPHLCPPPTPPTIKKPKPKKEGKVDPKPVAKDQPPLADFMKEWNAKYGRGQNKKGLLYYAKFWYGVEIDENLPTADVLEAIADLG